ncbi:transcriptional regulator NrdR [Candidatus Woesearchaeota archaeon]|nr:transcriptional regulator NrdR [Candidatus Woesearchaeota archaeon]MBW3021691.1 transcriptional regulator NrdR [Candidatus Woesearchaeota archaeon]
MKCPYCLSNETKVVDKRETSDFEVTRRRRECLKCEKRFTTYERIEMADLVVVKKDGRREAFDRDKLKHGLMKALQKRAVSAEDMDKIITEIELKLKGKEGLEVQSKYVGNLVMNRLKKIDPVAYIRFASVYKSFEDLDAFADELKKLKKVVKNGSD